LCISSFKRPVSIGVYGHPSHEVSRYILSVFEVTVEDDDFPYHQASKSDISDRDRDNKVNATLIIKNPLDISKYF